MKLRQVRYIAIIISGFFITNYLGVGCSQVNFATGDKDLASQGTNQVANVPDQSSQNPGAPGNPITPPLVTDPNGSDPGTGPIVQLPNFQIPSNTVAAIAFEDLYPRVGDADYNDFIAEFKIVPTVNTLGQLTDIVIEFYPRAAGAGYDHSLRLSLSGQVRPTDGSQSNIQYQTSSLFKGTAHVNLDRLDPSGKVLSSSTQDYQKDIVIFPSTHALFGNGTLTGVINSQGAYVPFNQVARLSIHLDQPELNSIVNQPFDASGFRPILHVKNTGFDIDLVDANPTNIDTNGNPFGLIIPADWQWMRETVAIDRGYPNFDLYRQYLLARASGDKTPAEKSVVEWFRHPDLSSNSLYTAQPLPQLLPLGN